MLISVLSHSLLLSNLKLIFEVTLCICQSTLYIHIHEVIGLKGRRIYFGSEFLLEVSVHSLLVQKQWIQHLPSLNYRL